MNNKAREILDAVAPVLAKAALQGIIDVSEAALDALDEWEKPKPKSKPRRQSGEES